jgi:hypothetical protein
MQRKEHEKEKKVIEPSRHIPAADIIERKAVPATVLFPSSNQRANIQYALKAPHFLIKALIFYVSGSL